MSPIVAYLDCVGGLAGDMLLGALLDAGAPREAIDEAVDALGLGEVKVLTHRAHRHGVGALQVDVVAGADVPRGAAAMVRAVEGAVGARPAVRERSLDALHRLIAAESRVHDVAPDELVLHELDGVDTLVDVVGTFALLDALGVDRVECSPIPYARGVIETRHGTIPGPGPAVLELLRGAAMLGVDIDAELVTPTGAAIATVAAARFGELPPMVLDRVGYGAGTREHAARPNLLRVVVGRSDEASVGDVVMVAADMDDVLPELVPDVVDACRAAGALDVWTYPVQMKKGRTGLEVMAVARPEHERPVARALLTHGTTLGVRVTRARRYELEREISSVAVSGHPVRVKVGILDGRVVNVAPEHDDCAAVAAATGEPVKRVWAEAMSAAQLWHGAER